MRGGRRHAGRVLTAVGAIVAVGGCAANGAAGEGSLSGCYQFERDAQADALGLPWGFELLEAPLEGWGEPDGRRVARTRLAPRGRDIADHPFGSWRVLAGDTVRVDAPGGGGFVLSLVPRERALAGEARAVGDARAPGQAGEAPPARPVVAQRVACPEPAAM